MDLRAVRGADVGSDHHLVLCKLRLKLKRAGKGKAAQLFNTCRQNIPEVKKQFISALSTDSKHCKVSQ